MNTHVNHKNIWFKIAPNIFHLVEFCMKTVIGKKLNVFQLLPNKIGQKDDFLFIY